MTQMHRKMSFKPPPSVAIIQSKNSSLIILSCAHMQTKKGRETLELLNIAYVSLLLTLMHSSATILQKSTTEKKEMGWIAIR